jgi:glycosyltransferase involved in cell wall biosynthesis
VVSDGQPISVIYSHPARQQNIYERPIWAHRLGLKVTLLTGIYFKPDVFPYSLTPLLRGKARTCVQSELNKRRREALPDEAIISVSGIAPEALCRPRGWMRTWNLIHDWYASRWLRDFAKRTSCRFVIFHGFQGSCMRSLREAKRAGMITAVEITQPLVAAKVIAEARRALGLWADDNGAFSEELAEVAEADFVIVQSRWSTSGLNEVRADVPVILLPLGVDTELFHPRNQAQPEFRLIYTGQIAIRKGIHDLLDAWKEVAANDAELLLVGEPTDDYGRKVAESIYPSVRRLPYQTHQQLAELYREASVFVGPSLSEAGFNSVFEAAASGLACVVSDHAGSLISDGVEGFVVTAGDVAALRARLDQLYRESELRRSMGAAARARAENFAWPRFGQRLVRAYQHMVESVVEVRTGLEIFEA